MTKSENENDHFDLDHFDQCESAHVRQLMQASLHSLNRRLDHFSTASVSNLLPSFLEEGCLV